MMQFQRHKKDGEHMLIQFTTGSVGNPEAPRISISARNAGIQPSSVTTALICEPDAEQQNSVKRTVQISPQEECGILDEVVLDEGPYLVIIRINSPTLILTVQAETKRPLRYLVELEDTWSWQGKESVERTAIPLAWGYLSRGVPF